MSARPRKHSLTLRGHATSVSLEDEFWTAFCEIAKAHGKSINSLASEIDTARGADPGLASAIRLFVLRHYRNAAKAMDHAPQYGPALDTGT